MLPNGTLNLPAIIPWPGANTVKLPAEIYIKIVVYYVKDFALYYFSFRITQLQVVRSKVIFLKQV